MHVYRLNDFIASLILESFKLSRIKHKIQIQRSAFGKMNHFCSRMFSKLWRERVISNLPDKRKISHAFSQACFYFANWRRRLFAKVQLVYFYFPFFFFVRGED